MRSGLYIWHLSSWGMLDKTPEWITFNYNKLKGNLHNLTHLNIGKINRVLINFNCPIYKLSLSVEPLKCYKMKAYGGKSLDDLEEDAGSLALSSFETGSWAFLALKLKDPSQVDKFMQYRQYVHGRIEYKLILDRLWSLGGTRRLFSTCLFGAVLWRANRRNLSEQTETYGTASYLGTKTSSSLSDSETRIALFFPPCLFTGEGVGGGVISMLQKER